MYSISYYILTPIVALCPMCWVRYLIKISHEMHVTCFHYYFNHGRGKEGALWYTKLPLYGPHSVASTAYWRVTEHIDVCSSVLRISQPVYLVCLFKNTWIVWPRKPLNFQWFSLILAKTKKSMLPYPNHIRLFGVLLKCLY